MTIQKYIQALRIRRSQLKESVLIDRIDGVFVEPEEQSRDKRYQEIRLITRILRIQKAPEQAKTWTKLRF